MVYQHFILVYSLGQSNIHIDILSSVHWFIYPTNNSINCTCPIIGLGITIDAMFHSYSHLCAFLSFSYPLIIYSWICIFCIWVILLSFLLKFKLGCWKPHYLNVVLVFVPKEMLHIIVVIDIVCFISAQGMAMYPVQNYSGKQRID